MKTWLILSINVLILLIVGLGYLRYIPTGQALRTAQPLTVKAEGMRSPVIVELFTSEGCSSCPPADEVLSRLEQAQPVAGAEIIALGEHVDYWNYIGWADPFSSPTFSQRQNDYTDVFGGTGAFTPQMVIDGQAELIGSKKDLALEAISRAARRP
ncbi:MAG TPA: DUF1223 domain-containing protein, partial [Blastocatellia bacterium]|nr:DUF1223 domain-containing protein [Blastocatellia bacterium]